jgi:hypothetical protein
MSVLGAEHTLCCPAPMGPGRPPVRFPRPGLLGACSFSRAPAGSCSWMPDTTVGDDHAETVRVGMRSPSLVLGVFTIEMRRRCSTTLAAAGAASLAFTNVTTGQSRSAPPSGRAEGLTRVGSFRSTDRNGCAAPGISVTANNSSGHTDEKKRRK